MALTERIYGRVRDSAPVGAALSKLSRMGSKFGSRLHPYGAALNYLLRTGSDSTRDVAGFNTLLQQRRVPHVIISN